VTSAASFAIFWQKKMADGNFISPRHSETLFEAKNFRISL
jgi:hypothetical protein